MLVLEVPVLVVMCAIAAVLDDRRDGAGNVQILCVLDLRSEELGIHKRNFRMVGLLEV